jgi:hypothetical protein
LDESFYVSANGSALKAFGYEYAYRSDWGRLQRLFIGVFGVVNLPTRIRARAVLWALRRISCYRVLDWHREVGKANVARIAGALPCQIA